MFRVQVYEEPLPAYVPSGGAADNSLCFMATTGCEILDSASTTAKALVERSAAFAHHKATTKSLADRADSVMFGVVSSALHRRSVGEDAIAQVQELLRVAADINAIMDEISAMGATMRNVNRSWTEHRLQSLGLRLHTISSALQISQGRSGLIEGVFHNQSRGPQRRLSAEAGSPWAASFRLFAYTGPPSP
ncbi:hypothetical protein BKA62DRAFT_715503 [Auriculariales sp. MPI-PUGE-AT-0066]|nr:hypothetical protein BKA62DRAFT_715503 [Auriculariales sp. MPI-PUGE-AT-0066]